MGEDTLQTRKEAYSMTACNPSCYSARDLTFPSGQAPVALHSPWQTVTQQVQPDLTGTSYFTVG